MVRTRREFPAVREVQILRDQRAPLSLRGAPKIRIGAAQELLSLHGVNVVPDVIQTGCNLQRQVLVQLCFHRMSGAAGTGRSSSADAAANAIAARRSSAFRVGKSARISSTESPAAKLANTVRKRTRVPLKTGSPPQIRRSRTIRSANLSC